LFYRSEKFSFLPFATGNNLKQEVKFQSWIVPCYSFLFTLIYITVYAQCLNAIFRAKYYLVYLKVWWRNWRWYTSTSTETVQYYFASAHVQMCCHLWWNTGLTPRDHCNLDCIHPPSWLSQEFFLFLLFFPDAEFSYSFVIYWYANHLQETFSLGCQHWFPTMICRLFCGMFAVFFGQAVQLL